MHAQLASRVLMVRPVYFGFNEETAVDNEFQHKAENDSKQEIRAKALKEFDGAVSSLEQAGVQVLVLDSGEDGLNTPDAVFPNNWFATFQSGTVGLFPMHAANRQKEKERYHLVEKLLLDAHLVIKSVLHLGPYFSHEAACEGTGSLVLDHVNRTVYAALSERTDEELVQEFATALGFTEVVTFHTQSKAGKQIYHTNVMMAILDGIAVVCTEAVGAGEQQRLLKLLAKRGEVLEISLEQAENNFCANILGLRNSQGSQSIVMSSSAFRGFTEQQKERLRVYGSLVVLDIPTIEFVGGGSARCMLAEVFLPMGDKKRRLSTDMDLPPPITRSATVILPR